ncbi:aminotransferase class IV [Plantactinospora sp. B5E13]|uniref:aminotransferase class IV n=1 Tax=unclassified Plantactinospora TaxID=2631981 RepID=UPI00325F3065
MSGRQIVAVLGRGVVPADEPVLRADDRGALHGDGLFETMHVRHGRPWLADEHLARLVRSAVALDLPLPPVEALRHLLGTACADWPTDTEGLLRLVCTRGPERGTSGTVYVTVSEVPESVRRSRRTGISVATLPLGVTAGARTHRPWLLAGLKTTSYAPNQAARRWAAANGVDDVLWVSTDGYALEGPSANLVWLTGDTLCTVPADTGILPGVTAGWLLDRATALGWTAARRRISPTDLHRTDGVWFTSSVRGLAEVRALDGVPLPASRHTAALTALLGFAEV